MSYKIELSSQCQGAFYKARLDCSPSTLQEAKDIIRTKINTCAEQLEQQGVSYEIHCTNEREYYKIPRENNSPLNPIFYKSIKSEDYLVELFVYLED